MLIEQVERCAVTLSRLVAATEDTGDLSARTDRVAAALPALKERISCLANDLHARVMHDAAVRGIDRRTGGRRRRGDRRVNEAEPETHRGS